VFDCDQDRLVFLDLLASYSKQYGLSLWGYCFSNHFHLVAVPAHEGVTAKVLGRLEADYARFLNVRRRTGGHLWQARYHSVAMESPHCWRALAYDRTQSRARGDDVGRSGLSVVQRGSTHGRRRGPRMARSGTVDPALD
jgi:hypothetical protein